VRYGLLRRVKAAEEWDGTGRRVKLRCGSYGMVRPEWAGCGSAGRGSQGSASLGPVGPGSVRRGSRGGARVG